MWAMKKTHESLQLEFRNFLGKTKMNTGFSKDVKMANKHMKNFKTFNQQRNTSKCSMILFCSSHDVYHEENITQADKNVRGKILIHY